LSVQRTASGGGLDVYILLLSLHLRLNARPPHGPWIREEVLCPPPLQLLSVGNVENISVYAEVYLYVRKLSEITLVPLGRRDAHSAHQTLGLYVIHNFNVLTAHTIGIIRPDVLQCMRWPYSSSDCVCDAGSLSV
jgi:hypothetical protein